MFNIGLLSGRRTPHPIGEQTYTTGAGSFIVPDGVTRLSVVLIGQGGNGVQFAGANRSAGSAGALTYKNDLTVTPGQSIAYRVTGAGAVTFGDLVANNGVNGASNGAVKPGGAASMAGEATASFSGGNGGVASGATAAQGGSTSNYLADGANGGTTGVGLFGVGSTGNYGRGATSVYSGSPSTAGSGAIRIIWGDGRSFPNNAA